jgi:hypothetical protein
MDSGSFEEKADVSQHFFGTCEYLPTFAFCSIHHLVSFPQDSNIVSCMGNAIDYHPWHPRRLRLAMRTTRCRPSCTGGYSAIYSTPSCCRFFKDKTVCRGARISGYMAGFAIHFFLPFFGGSVFSYDSISIAGEPAIETAI